MRRFLLACALAASCITGQANAQTGERVARVGVLLAGDTTPERVRYFEAFREELRDLGWVEGRALIASGLDVLTISRRLGHASPTITLGVYGHLFSNTDDRAAEVINAALSSAKPE